MELETELPESKREELKTRAIGKFKDLYGSDQELVEDPDFGSSFSKSLITTMLSHDREEVEKAYTVAGLNRAMTYLHIPVEKRVEAGFCYADALFAKDTVEERFRDSGGDLKTGKMFRDDGYDREKIYLNTGKKEADFRKKDLGDWERVYDCFRRETGITVQSFFSENSGELADAAALFETVAWRKHKVGGEIAEKLSDNRSRGNPGYLEEFGAAIQLKMRAALQEENYPEKDSHGSTGPGPLPTKYLTLVEHHDQRNVEEAEKDVMLFAERLNQDRRSRMGEIEMKYSSRS